MLIDSHCHLDALEFDADRDQVIEQAQVAGMVVPAVEVGNFETVRALARSHAKIVYALGIHPMYVQRACEQDLQTLDLQLAASMADPRLVAVGEIGLDFFVTELSTGSAREKQLYFYEAQLMLAKKYELPVILHVRRSQDTVLKYLRRYKLVSGVAHAFNGSEQQARAFTELGFCLGFGGAATYERALQIRRLVSTLSAASIVLETDAPDISPEWLHRHLPAEADRRERSTLRNTPGELPRIAGVIAKLRGVSLGALEASTTANVLRVLPRSKEVFTSLN